MKTFISTDIEFRKLAENIQVARKRRKLSLAELSIKAGVSKTVLTRIEAGDSSVGVGKVFNVLDALGLLKGLSDIANPELDKEQSLKEIQEIRSSYKNSKNKKSKLVRFV